MTDFTIPPKQTVTPLILNNGDTLTVSAGGRSEDVTVNKGATENITAGGLGVRTTVNDGGKLNVNGPASGDFNFSIDFTTINGGLVNLTHANADHTRINFLASSPFSQMDLHDQAVAVNPIIEGGSLQGAFPALVVDATSRVVNLKFVNGGGGVVEVADPSSLQSGISGLKVGNALEFGGVAAGNNITVTSFKLTNNQHDLEISYNNASVASYHLTDMQANTTFQISGRDNGVGGSHLSVLTVVKLGVGGPAAFDAQSAGTNVYTAEFGSAPDATELNVLSQFAQAQFDYGQQIGVQDPGVYAFEALGVALASGQHFQNEFGPSNSMYPASAAGDAQFVTDAYTSVFGHAGTTAQIQHFSDQLSFVEGLYTAAGMFGSPSNIDLLARGAVYGQMLGIAPTDLHSV
jgi:autotransporter passenger strand-loop-strand repeat protein